MTVDLNRLAAEIHEAAVEKGFWDVDEAEIKHIAKMHSELSEALQEDRCGMPLLYVDDIEVMDRITDPAQFDGRKPEGVAAELADFVMMALDWIAMCEAILPVGHPHDWLKEAISDDELLEHDTCVLVCVLHEELCKATHDMSMLHKSICIVNEWLHARGIDLLEVIRLKMEYNKSRPRLHGRLY